MMRASVILFCILPSSAIGHLNYGGNIRSDTEFVSIRHLHSEHGRTRRDASGMPERLVLDLELSTGRVVFNLTRSERDHHDIPVVLRHGDRAFIKDVKKNNDQAIYNDKNQNAALMVEKTATDEYNVAGLFHIGETPHDIWPEHGRRRSTRDTGGVHVVSAVFNLNFTGDAVLNDVYWKRKPEFDRQLKLLKDKHQRQKRSNVQQHTIELCFFSDNADWNRFLVDAGGNAVQAEADLRLFYAFIEQAMNVRYANLPPNQVCVQVQVKAITIFMTLNTPSWIFNHIKTDGTINTSDGIDEMAGDTTGTTGSAASQGTACDHFMLFSGRELSAIDNGAMIDINGIAFRGALCDSRSVSIVENDRNGAVCHVAAHELGHSQNAEHDVDAGCNDADGFIMATAFTRPMTVNPGNFFSFSTCSINTFIAFYNTLNTQNDNCALVENVPGGSALATNGMIAGQVTDADAQCARAFPGTRFCRRTTILDDMCQTILCGVDAGTGEDCPNSIVPVDRTSCGNQRWCVQGQCIQANGAPARAPNCPQGDDPNRSCNQARCPFSPVVCCETCGVVPPTVAFPTTTGTATTTTTVTASGASTATTSGASTATTSGTSVTSGVALSVVRFNIILC